MTKKEKIAIETAHAIALSPGSFGVKTQKKVKVNIIVAKTLESLFEFDENGSLIGFDAGTVESLYGLSKRP